MLRKFLLSCVALLFGFGAVAAQETQPPKSPEPGLTARRMRPGREFHMLQRRERREARAFGARLNLTDDQKKLGQSVRQKYFAATKPQREQLFQLREKRLAGNLTDADRQLARSVRREMMTAMRNMHQESLGVLTPDQRSQLEGMREQRKQRREEMRQRRGDMRQRREEQRSNRPPLE